MIAFVRGILRAAAPGEAVVEVGGVGYRLLVPAGAGDRLPPPGQTVTLHTHLHVREDGLSLYGFITPTQLRLFELLLTVSGIGPRLALGVVGATTPDAFYQAVATNDPVSLARLPGIGRKTAQKVILELRDRVAGQVEEAPPGAEPAPGDTWGQAVEALMALGYSRAEAVGAVNRARSGLPPDAGLEAVLKEALRALARL
jgi:Holliday junction DNA helicase RuvA